MQCNLEHQAQQVLQHSFLDTGIEHVIIILLPWPRHLLLKLKVSRNAFEILCGSIVKHV
jgi:hypothetical protein